MTNNIVICDSERGYAERLMEYLHRKLPAGYEVALFTSKEKLLESCRVKDVLLLVIAEREYDREVAVSGFASILVLNETGSYLGENVINFSKYQSIDTIAAIIRQMIARESPALPGSVRHAGPMHIFGVYTPVSGCLQTTFSLTMGQVLSRKGKVLYLNFENYSGLDRMLEKSFRGSVADLLYYQSVAKEKLSGQLNVLAETVGGLDLIPPMKSFIELRSISGSQWLELFHAMEQITEYEYLILDLSEQVDNLFLILRECEQIFTILKEDIISAAKVSSYEQLLQANGCEDIAVKTKRLIFPVFRELPTNMENLTHGELAEYVRSMLREMGYL